MTELRSTGDVYKDPSGSTASEAPINSKDQISFSVERERRGVLGLASAFASSGWVLGFSLMFMAGFLAIFSLHLLNILAMKFPDRDVSYYTVAEAYAPWSRWIVDITIVVKCFGVAVSYLQVAGDVLSSLIIHWITSTTVTPFLVRALVIAGSGLLMAPVCMAKSVKNTFITNVLAVVTIGYCVILGIIYADPSAGDDSAGIPEGSSVASVLAKLPIFIFAFTCHQNMFLTANDLKRRTQKHLDIIIVAAESTAMLLYIPAVIFTYITYGSAARANFMLNIDLGYVPVQIGYIALAIGVLCSYTLQVVPTIRSLIVLVTRDKEDQLSTMKRRILFYSVAALCQLAPVATAVAVRSLGVTFSFVGIIGSNTISYIMPSFLFCTMYRKTKLRKDAKYVMSSLLLLLSLVLVPVCIGSLIQQIITGKI
ncbi:hypothetical protein FOZ63_005078 [Perkinsus olseni]|uniref:Amino acid transporter transmembrane domain-containing protein n=1 Tax=Perkinsus olseni TaxID=32597 RepID=A0A7J6S4W7_PEROL|nr:hypothetical protein FOZ63_005078 [Perkinsus olseni]